MPERKSKYENIEVVCFFDGQKEAGEVFTEILAFDLAGRGRNSVSEQKIGRNAERAMEGSPSKEYNNRVNRIRTERPDCAGEDHGN